MSLYDRLIRHRYGTYRGLIRSLLAETVWRLGRLDDFAHPDLSRVERLVFVCLGNVCRSPYAHLLAAAQGLPAASFGLSTTTGAPAYEPALAAADRAGHDMHAHRATDLDDFEIRDGDLLLVMEVRQARRLQARLGGARAQIAFLGQWAQPRRVHIHDPMTLSDGYFDHCYRVIETAVTRLGAAWRAARAA